MPVKIDRDVMQQGRFEYFEGEHVGWSGSLALGIDVEPAQLDAAKLAINRARARIRTVEDENGREITDYDPNIHSEELTPSSVGVKFTSAKFQLAADYKGSLGLGTLKTVTRILLEELAKARIDAVVHGLDDGQWLLDAERLEG